MLLLINVNEPVVFVVRLVKVLLLIDVVKFKLATVIAVIAPVPATEWLSCVKLLLFTLSTLVVDAEPDG